MNPFVNSNFNIFHANSRIIKVVFNFTFKQSIPWGLITKDLKDGTNRSWPLHSIKVMYFLMSLRRKAHTWVWATTAAGWTRLAGWHHLQFLRETQWYRVDRIARGPYASQDIGGTTERIAGKLGALHRTSTAAIVNSKSSKTHHHEHTEQLKCIVYQPPRTWW